MPILPRLGEMASAKVLVGAELQQRGHLIRRPLERPATEELLWMPYYQVNLEAVWILHLQGAG